MKQNLFASEKITVNKPNCSDYSLQYFCMAVIILCIRHTKTKTTLTEKHGGYIQRSLLCSQMRPAEWIDGFHFDQGNKQAV